MNIDKASEEVAQLLSSDKFGIFVGAGLSKPAGLPEWKQLVAPYAKELGLDVNKENPLRIMQYFAANNQANLSRLKERLRIMVKKAKVQPTHRLLARMRLPRIWTTNYDELLETAYRDEGQKPEVISTDDQLSNASYLLPQIIKMHGDLTMSSIILLEEDYELYELTRHNILALFQQDFRSCSMLFLGVSFDDPNLRKVAASLRITDGRLHPHYLLTARSSRFINKHERRIYSLWKKDLARFNVTVIELRSFDEIESFLLRLIKYVFGTEVVILGSFRNDSYNLLCKKLGEELARKDFNIYSGGGQYAGTVVAEGAWEHFKKRGIKPYEKIEFIFREGGGSSNPQKGRITYIGEDLDEMRKHLISSDRICIVLGGGEGTKTEVTIARYKGCPVVPVGITGGTAQKVWEEERYRYQKDRDFKSMQSTFKLLNKINVKLPKIINATIKLVDFLSHRRISL